MEFDAHANLHVEIRVMGLHRGCALHFLGSWNCRDLAGDWAVDTFSTWRVKVMLTYTLM